MNISKFIFVITDKCNLNCKYCYVKKKKIKLNNKTLNSLINIIKISNSKKKLLVITGGEPLIEYDNIKKIINLLKNEKNIQISIASNGLLLNKEKLDYFKKNKVNLMISYDGKYNSSKSRIFVSGKDSTEYIRTKLSLIRNYKKICGLRMTITPNNSKYLYKNFKELLKYKLRFDIQPNIGIIWNNKNILNWINNLDKIGKEYVKLYPKIKIKTFDESLIEDNSNCSLGKDILTILPNGDVLPCNFFLCLNNKKRKKISCGNINKKIYLERIYKWSKFSIKNKKTNRICLCLDSQNGEYSNEILETNYKLFEKTQNIKKNVISELK